MTDIVNLAYRVKTGDIEKANRQLDKLGISTQKAGTDARRTGGVIDRSMRQASGSIKAASRSFHNMGIAIQSAAVLSGIGFVAAVKSVSNYAASVQEVSTLVDTATFDMGALSDEAFRQARQFGTMPIEQMNAFYQAISAGADTAEQATDALTVANQLALGGVTDVTTAMDGLTTIMNAYNGKAGSFTDIADSMFVAMRAGKTTIGELSASIGNIAPIAEKAGVKLEEVMAASAALTKGGVTTSIAMNGLRAIMTAVIKPTSEAKKMAEELGLQFDAAALKTMGFAGFLEEVKKQTEGSTDKLAVLFGGVEALLPIMALTGTAGEDFAKILVNMGFKANEAKLAVDKMINSPGFQSRRLIAELSSRFIQLGYAISTKLTPYIKILADTVGPAFDALSDGLDKIGREFQVFKFALQFDDGPLYSALRRVGDVFDYLGDSSRKVVPYLDEFGVALAGVAGASIIFTGLAGAVGLLTAPIVLISAFATSVYAIYDNWDGIVEWWENLWSDMGEIADKNITDMELMFSRSNLAQGFESTGDDITRVWEYLWDDLGDVLSDNLDEMTRFISRSNLAQGFESTGDDIMRVWEYLWDSVVNFFIEQWDQLIDVIQWDAFVNKIKSVGPRLIDAGAQIWDSLIEGMKRTAVNVVDDAEALGRDVIDGLLAGLGERATAIRESITGVGQDLISSLKNVLKIQSPSRVMAEIGRQTMEGLVQGINAGSQQANEAAIRIALSLKKQFILLTEGEEGMRRYEMGLNGIASATQDTLIEAEKFNRELENQLRIEARVSGQLRDIARDQRLTNIAVTEGGDAARRAALELDGYTNEQARNAVAMQNNIVFQREFHQALVRSITSATSIKDAFTNLGGWMKNWLKEQIAHFAANKIFAYLGIGGGGVSGLLNGLGGGSAISGVGTGPGVGGVAGAGGTAAGGTGIAALGAQIAVMAVAAHELGREFGRLAGGNEIAAGIGAVLLGPIGAAIGGAFGSSKHLITEGVQVGIQNGYASANVLNHFAREQSFYRGTETTLELGGVNSQVQNSINDMMTDLGDHLSAQFGLLGVAGSDAILDGFNVAMVNIYGDDIEGQIENFIADTTLAAYQHAFGQLSTQMQTEILTSMDGMSVVFGEGMENIGRMIDPVLVLNNALEAGHITLEEFESAVTRLVLSAQLVVPTLEDMGLAFNGTAEQATIWGAGIVDALGGVEPAAQLMQLAIQELYTPMEALNIAAEGSTAALAEWNASVGLSGEAAVTSTQGLFEWIAAQDASTEAGQQAIAGALLMLPAFESIGAAGEMAGQNMDAVANSFAVLGIAFDTASPAAQAFADEVVELAGGLDAFGAQVGQLMDNLFTVDEQALLDTALAGQAVADFNQIMGLTGDQMITSTEGLRVWLDEFDGAFTPEQLAALLEVQGALGELTESGLTAQEAIAALPPELQQLYETITGTTIASSSLTNGVRELGNGAIEVTAQVAGADAAIINIGNTALVSTTQVAGADGAISSIGETAVTATGQVLGADGAISSMGNDAIVASSQLGTITITISGLGDGAIAASGQLGTITITIGGLGSAATSSGLLVSGLATRLGGLGGETSLLTGTVGRLGGAIGNLDNAANNSKNVLSGYGGFLRQIANSAAGAARSAASAANDAHYQSKRASGLIQGIKEISSRASGIANNIGKTAKIDGSYSTGLPYVRSDGHIAELHKGEMVVPENVSSWLRSAGIQPSAPASNSPGIEKRLDNVINELAELRRDQNANSGTANRALGQVVSSSERQVSALEDVERSNDRAARAAQLKRTA